LWVGSSAGRASDF